MHRSIKQHVKNIGLGKHKSSKPRNDIDSLRIHLVNVKGVPLIQHREGTQTSLSSAELTHRAWTQPKKTKDYHKHNFIKQPDLVPHPYTSS